MSAARPLAGAALPGGQRAGPRGLFSAESCDLGAVSTSTALDRKRRPISPRRPRLRAEHGLPPLAFNLSADFFGTVARGMVGVASA